MHELYHHGVLGMKWGIRRYQNADGTLTEAGKKHYQKRIESMETAFDNVRKHDAEAANYRDRLYDLRSKPRLTEFHDARERKLEKKEARTIKKRNKIAADYEDMVDELVDEIGEKTLRELNPKYAGRQSEAEKLIQAMDKAFADLEKKGYTYQDGFDSRTEAAYWREFYDELDHQLGYK